MVWWWSPGADHAQVFSSKAALWAAMPSQSQSQSYHGHSHQEPSYHSQSKCVLGLWHPLIVSEISSYHSPSPDMNPQKGLRLFGINAGFQGKFNPLRHDNPPVWGQG